MPLLCRLHESSSDLVNWVYMCTHLQLSFAVPEAIQLFGTFISPLLIGSSSSCCAQKGTFPVAICYLTKPSCCFFGILMVFDANLTWLFLKQRFNSVFYLKQTLTQLHQALEVLLWNLSQSLLPLSQHLLNWVLGWEVGGFPHQVKGIPDKYCSMPSKAAVQHMLGSMAPSRTVGVICWDTGASEVSEKSLQLPGDLTGVRWESSHGKTLSNLVLVGCYTGSLWYVNLKWGFFHAVKPQHSHPISPAGAFCPRTFADPWKKASSISHPLEAVFLGQLGLPWRDAPILWPSESRTFCFQISN